jgi:hypothetical protein
MKSCRALREQALHYYKLVVAGRLPSFSVSVLRKDDGPLIRYERLLLPFTCNGDDVERIVGIITLFSEENGFGASDVTTGKLVGLEWSTHRPLVAQTEVVA